MLSKQLLRANTQRHALLAMTMLAIATIVFVQLVWNKNRHEPRLPQLPPLPENLQILLDKRVSYRFTSAVQGGLLVHTIPGEMTVGKHEMVDVRVGKDFSTILRRMIEGDGEIQKHSIKVTNTMGVVLKGTPDYFMIELQTPGEEKYHPKSDFAEWVFDVAPLKSGSPNIYLSPYIVLETTQGNKLYQPTITKTVIVHPNRLGSIHGFIQNNWQFIATICLSILAATGLLGLIGTWVMKRRELKELREWEKEV